MENKVIKIEIELDCKYYEEYKEDLLEDIKDRFRNNKMGCNSSKYSWSIKQKSPKVIE